MDPQTASQINGPQTGEIQLRRPFTASELKAQIDKLRDSANEGMKKARAVKPAGWWSLPDITGTIAGVSAAIDAAQDVPAEWKAAIKSEVSRAAAAASLNAVYLDAHFTVDGGNSTLHLTIQPAKMLT